MVAMQRRIETGADASAARRRAVFSRRLAVLAVAAIALLGGCGNAVAPPVDVVQEPTAAATINLRSLSAEELAVLDPRRARQNPRSRDLLVVELLALESLRSATSAGSPDVSKITRRLAEDYTELSAAALRDASRGGDSAEASKAAREYVRARTESMKYYRALADRTGACPGRADADACSEEATFYLAFELWNAGDQDGARRYLLGVIQRRRDPDIIARSYFLFGVMFEAAGQSALAQQSFAEAEKGAAGQSHELAGLARARLGGASPGRGAESVTDARFGASA